MVHLRLVAVPGDETEPAEQTLGVCSKNVSNLACASATLCPSVSSFETYDRISKLFGWPQTFAVTGTRGAD